MASYQGYVPLEIMEQREAKIKAAFALTLWRICEKFPESERDYVFRMIAMAVEEVAVEREQSPMVLDEWKFNIDCKETNVYVIGHC